MKRYLFKLFVFLLLGTIVNVAVMGGFMPWGRPPSLGIVQKELASLAEKYSISIAIAQRPFAIPPSPVTIRGYAAREHDVRLYVPIFVSEFSIYPGDFVRNTNLRRIVLCGYLAVGASPVAAIPDLADGTLYFDVGRASNFDLYQRKAIHHEFFHLADYSDDDTALHDDEWANLNPRPFEYGTGGWSLENDPTASVLTDSIPGFLNKYSTSGVEEDKAEVFANMIVDFAAVEGRAKMDPVIRNKVEMMKNLVLRISPDMTADFWDSLPVRPRSRSSVINSIFYAALLWVVICGPFVLLRLIRRERGLCIKCGYDLRGAEHEVCPERGAGGSL